MFSIIIRVRLCGLFGHTICLEIYFLKTLFSFEAEAQLRSQRHTQNTVEHLRWSFFAKTVDG